MQTKRSFLWLLVALTIGGCAQHTTDPRQGGLFSYNPTAYEQRLADRQQQLQQLQQQEQTERGHQEELERQKRARSQEKAALEQELHQMHSSLAAMEQKLKKIRLQTTEQRQEQKRILQEINKLKLLSQSADMSEENKGKRRELEALKKKRDQLEKEAAELMLL